MPKNKAHHASTNSQSVSEDEMWDGSGSETPGSEGLRVRVEMSAYWGAPAACLLWARPARAGRARRVRHLARRLRAVAALRRPFCLLAAGAALAPGDPLCLLRPDEQLRVVPVEHEWQKPFSLCEEEDAAESPAPRLAGGPRPGRSPPRPVSPAPTPAPSITPSSRLNDHSLTPVWMDSTSAADHASPATSLDLTECKPTPVASPVRPVSSVGGECGGGDAALWSVKRRALAMLERVQAAAGDKGGEPGGAGDDPDGAPARKRRRRVRRRRPAPGLGPETAPWLESEMAPGLVSEMALETGPEPDPPAPAEPFAFALQTYQSPAAVASAPAPASVPAAPAPASVAAAPAVRRNERGARAPRLVRALPAAADTVSNDIQPPLTQIHF